VGEFLSRHGRFEEELACYQEKLTTALQAGECESARASERERERKRERERERGWERVRSRSRLVSIDQSERSISSNLILA
jgi:hypothetical protein